MAKARTGAGGTKASGSKARASKAAPATPAAGVDSNTAGKAEALALHVAGRPGKLESALTKLLITQQDLSLIYSPSVAWPCLAIRDDPATAYDYTARGNMVSRMTKRPIIFALANPDPKIRPDDVRAAKPGAIIATKMLATLAAHEAVVTGAPRAAPATLT
jgi:malic enzyme